MPEQHSQYKQNNSINHGEGRVFFLDAPGGTVKTFPMYGALKRNSSCQCFL